METSDIVEKAAACLIVMNFGSVVAFTLAGSLVVARSARVLSELAGGFERFLRVFTARGIPSSFLSLVDTDRP